jgi:uncharacterized protein
LDRGANLEHQNKDGDTPLLVAIEENRVKTAQLLLDRGADLEHQDNYGSTALGYALRYDRDLELIYWMVQASVQRHGGIVHLLTQL